jgi:hypothetical protein
VRACRCDQQGKGGRRVSAKVVRADRNVKRMEQASEALHSGDYFKCVGLASEALREAHAAGDYALMARILMPLEEARRQIRIEAMDSKHLVVIDTAEALEELSMETGCYLMEPMLVAADGRSWRERAELERVAVLVVVHEPLTLEGDWPLVMVGPVTIRTRVAPPKKVTIGWLAAANEAIGEEAIENSQSARSEQNQLDELFAALQTLPDNDRLHQQLHELCEVMVRQHTDAS